MVRTQVDTKRETVNKEISKAGAAGLCEKVAPGQWRTVKAVLLAEIPFVAIANTPVEAGNDDLCPFCLGSTVVEKKAFGLTTCTACSGTGKRKGKR